MYLTPSHYFQPDLLLKKIFIHIYTCFCFPDSIIFLVSVNIYFLLGTISLPGVAWVSSGTDATKTLTLKPSGSLASVMVTGSRVTVNEFCTSLNRKTIEPCWLHWMKSKISYVTCCGIGSCFMTCPVPIQYSG